MNALLDTCAVLWAAREPERLSARARALLLVAARHLRARILPVRLEHISVLQQLPVRRRDPFDRLLIAQAVAGQLALVTSDQAIAAYPEAACVW